MTDKDPKVIPFPLPEKDEFDPLADLCDLADKWREEHGLTADEAIEYLLAKVRHEPLSPALAAKVSGTALDPEARTFTLRYKLARVGDRWRMEDLEGLGLTGEPGGGDKDPLAEVSGFLADLLFAWDHYVRKSDSELTSDARELKRKLLAKFGLGDVDKEG